MDLIPGFKLTWYYTGFTEDESAEEDKDYKIADDSNNIIDINDITKAFIRY